MIVLPSEPDFDTAIKEATKTAKELDKLKQSSGGNEPGPSDEGCESLLVCVCVCVCVRACVRVCPS